MIKRYYTLNDEMKKIFGQKIVKLSLDGGFTCPTRDGTKGTRGCVFCSETGSGEFSGSMEYIRLNSKENIQEELAKINIKNQIDSQIKLLSDKWSYVKYIAYFQNFTNTYADTKYLYALYEEAIKNEDVVGLAIATRADCLDDDVMGVLDYFNKKTFLFVEIGLQSIHEKSEKFIRRGYDLKVFEKSLEKLNEKNIKTVIHTIVGLPTESVSDMMVTYRYLREKNIWGIKIQQLNILKNTDLAKYYEQNKFELMSVDEYISFVCDVIENLRDDIVVHRITGDGAKQELIEPRWILNKRYILNGVDKELKARDSYQGKYKNCN